MGQTVKKYDKDFYEFIKLVWVYYHSIVEEIKIKGRGERERF